MPRTPARLLSAALLLSTLALAVAPRTAASAWPHDPTVNLPLCAVTGDQRTPRAVPDGAGGTIVAWVDRRGGSNWDIYVQRVSATGVVQWTVNGVALCTASGEQSAPAIVSDGAGGAIVAWADYRNPAGDVFAQRISAAGVVQWAVDGVPVCAAAGNQGAPTIGADGAGGAIVAWTDYRNGNADVYAQKVSAAGAVQWTADGVAVCTATGDQYSPALVTSPWGEAFVTWADYRSGTGDIYLQGVSSAGAALWTTNGVAVCTATGDQYSPVIVHDGAGGVVVAWQDYRSGTSDIYAQRVSSSFNQWTANGVALCAASGNQLWPAIVPDGAGGAIVTWYDYRSGNWDVYAQRVSGGIAQWTANGVALCTATGDQTYPAIAVDGTGGAVVAWSDYRSGANHIYAQRVSSAGAVQWTANGLALSTASGNQYYPNILASGTGGAFVAWEDTRAGSHYDLYCQRVDEWGYLGAEPNIASVKDVPNDQGGAVKVSWNASPLDVDPLFRNVDNYLVFRSAPPNAVAPALRAGTIATQDPREAASLPGRLLVTTAGSLTYYWEYVGAQEAYHLSTYSMVAPTTGDSIAGSNPLTAFLVQAWAVGGAQWWSSTPDSGYSVDNLAPTTPAPFTGEYAAGAATLHWAVSTAPDLGEYRLYRGSGADFVPGPGNLVAAQPDTGYVDPAGAVFYYKLCAVDVHGNASAFGTLLPSGTVDVAGPALPHAVFLAAPAPNPARGATTLRFGLPREARVELALYDQQGRRVRSLAAGPQPAGEHTLAWDGRDGAGRQLPAGLYFVRLEVEGRAHVSRLAVVR